MFKFNNKDTRTTPIATPIVNFEHISHLLVFLLSTLNTWLPAGITWRVLIINNYTLEYPLSDWSSHLYIGFSNPLLQNICLENSIFPNYIIPICYIRTYLTLKYMHFYLYIYLYLSVCLSVLYICIYIYIYVIFCFMLSSMLYVSCFISKLL